MAKRACAFARRRARRRAGGIAIIVGRLADAGIGRTPEMTLALAPHRSACRALAGPRAGCSPARGGPGTRRERADARRPVRGHGSSADRAIDARHAGNSPARRCGVRGDANSFEIGRRKRMPVFRTCLRRCGSRSDAPARPMRTRFATRCASASPANAGSCKSDPK